MNVIESGWRSPSNIALVKYWGKRDNQIPSNPSVSMTLSESFTETRIIVTGRSTGNEFVKDFYFHDKPNEPFKNRVEGYIKILSSLFEWLHDVSIEIHSSNSFPHSAGIASSASFMSSLALSLCDVNEAVTGIREKDFFKLASNIARLGSGSAARSVYGGYSLWGEVSAIANSSDLNAIKLTNIHPDFLQMNDTILIVDSNPKAISSSQGHSLMTKNMFADKRYEQAKINTLELLQAFEENDEKVFFTLVEQEALTLHGLMMLSKPGYILLKPNTIEIIEKIKSFRTSSGLNFAFTLDAGPNIHLIYPDRIKSDLLSFIKNDLTALCEGGKIIYDRIGNGPERLA